MAKPFSWLNYGVDIERAEQYHVILVEGVALLASLCFVTYTYADGQNLISS